jgi:hypothetical protein
MEQRGRRCPALCVGWLAGWLAGRLAQQGCGAPAPFITRFPLARKAVNAGG